MNVSRSRPNNSRELHSAFVLVFGFGTGVLFAFLAFSNVGRECRQATDFVRSSPLAVQSKTSRKALQEDKDGWKTIDVFYGTTAHLPKVSNLPIEKFYANKYHSQVKQDEIVAKLHRFKQGGFFLDLAANDAVSVSNTYALEAQFGWTGICIEPNSVYWPSLSYRRCHIVGAVAGNDREEIDFQFSGGAMGGIVGENFDNTGANKSQRGRSPRLTVTLEEILTRSNAPTDIDYFSLDVEGAEDIALQAPVLKQYRFKVMTLERPKQSLQDLLVANGYVMLKKLSPFGETLWAHTATLPELDLKGAGIEYTAA